MSDFERFRVRRLLFEKTAYEAKGQQHIAGKVIQRLFNIDDTYPFMFIKLFITSITLERSINFNVNHFT